MDENVTSQEKTGKGRKVVLGVFLGILGLLILAYLGLCIYVGASEKILPGVYAAGADLGGMTQAQAEQAVERAVSRAYSGVRYTLRCGENIRELDGTLAAVDARAAARTAFAVGRSETFLKRGAVILAHLTGREFQIECPVFLSQEGDTALEQALDEFAARERVALVETVWAVEEDTLVLRRGVTGVTVDREEARLQVKESLLQCQSLEVEVRLLREEPEAVDFQEIYDTLFVAPQDAYVQREGCTVMPHVVGVSFDVEQAAEQFSHTPEGGVMRVELTRTVPQLTQERLAEMLFADVLGECTTSIGGSENRLNNVILAAQFIDGTILMPGDVFSYNDVVGPRTTARGFLPAPAYIGGKTVDDVGGGICQDSSTLYLAALLANLTIVERVNHMYAVGYVPDGMDATVAYGAIDFKFENSTPYPIRIEARVEEHQMIVVLHGTKTDDITVKMTNKVISTNPAKVVYKEDPSIPRGRTKVDVTPYDGRKVEVYRNLYDGEGRLISQTLETVNRYSRRDKVILYNPADAVALGLAGPEEPSQGTVLPVTPPEEGGGQSQPETPTEQTDTPHAQPGTPAEGGETGQEERTGTEENRQSSQGEPAGEEENAGSSGAGPSGEG